MLPEIDQGFLDDRVPGNSVTLDAGHLCVILPSFSLPQGFTETEADLLLRLSPGYPDVAPDMWWFSPYVLRSDGSAIPATEVREIYFGRQWQRWSRHLQPGQWRAGVDSLQSFIALVRMDLDRARLALAA